MRKSCFDGAVGIEQGKISQHDDIVALLSCALGQNGHSADYVAACTGDELFHCSEALAGGYNVVNDEDALALDKLGVGRVDNKALHVHGGDGLDVDFKHAAHVSLGAFSGEEVFLRAALARHFV